MNLKHSKLAKKQNLSGIAATLLIAVLIAANVYQLNDRERDVSRELFNLAREHYVQGQYDACLGALTRLHDIGSPTENSKELEDFCGQGKELVKRERELEENVERKIASEALKPRCLRK